VTGRLAIQCHSFFDRLVGIVGRAILPADQLSSWSSRLKRRLQPRLTAPPLLNRVPA
jgi:hypothetical protein